MSWKLASKIVKLVIFRLNFTLHFSTKQPIETTPIHNQYIYFGCFSISPIKDKITMIICNHKGKKENNEKRQETRPKIKGKRHEFSSPAGY